MNNFTNVVADNHSIIVTYVTFSMIMLETVNCIKEGCADKS